jgi:hypothetical protein
MASRVGSPSTASTFGRLIWSAVGWGSVMPEN